MWERQANLSRSEWIKWWCLACQFDTAGVGIFFLGGLQRISIHNGIVGVTSWGASDPNKPKDNWSSRLGRNEEYPKKDYTNAGSKMKGQGNIGSLLNSICKVKLSGKTLYSLGYCK